MDITIYTTSRCYYCGLVKEYLEKKNLEWTEKDVAADPKAAREMLSKTGNFSVPVTVINGKVVIGYDKIKLDQLTK